MGPKRAEEGAYVWQKLMKSGAVVANGTDAPVEDVNPIASFYASVTRKMKDGRVFYPDQRMSREEALRSYTLNNAYAAFEEKLKGSLGARQARRHHRPYPRHNDRAGKRDTVRRGGVHHRGRRHRVRPGYGRETLKTAFADLRTGAKQNCSLTRSINAQSRDQRERSSAPAGDLRTAPFGRGSGR